MCTCICAPHKSSAEYWLVAGPGCSSVSQEAQSGRTRGSPAALAPVTHEACSMGRKLLGGGVEAKLMTWCVTETHHLECDTSI